MIKNKNNIYRTSPKIKFKTSDHLDKDDLLSMSQTANYLGMSYQNLRNYVFLRRVFKIDVYLQHPDEHPSKSKYFFLKEDVLKLRVPVQRTRIFYLPQGVYMDIAEVTRYLSHPMHSTSKRLLIQESIFKEKGAIMTKQANRANPLVNLSIRTVSLSHLNKYMKRHVRRHLHCSIYYHRILYDGMPIFPDDPRYTRVENLRDWEGITYSEMMEERRSFNFKKKSP